MSFPVCAYCGSPFPGRKRSKYCNWDCYCKYRKAASLGVESVDEEEIILGPCKFNDGVRCPSQVGCDQCGWNPEVAQARLTRILAKMFGVEEVLADDTCSGGQPDRNSEQAEGSESALPANLGKGETVCQFFG